jgi:hypothetical protein
MMVVSTEAPLCRQAGFQISNAIRCFWCMWPAHSPDLGVLEYFLQAYVKSKVYEMRPANTDYLKQQIQECTQKIP